MLKTKIRLLLVDDHEVVRLGLRALFEGQGDFEVLGEAATAAEAVARARVLKPDVVIMDVRLPDASGAEACRRLLAELPDTRVLMLTSYADEEAIVDSVLAGAHGYLLKRVWSNDLLEAVRRINLGESLLDASISSEVIEGIRGLAGKETPPWLETLTAQEKKILSLISQAKTNQEIAQELFLSEKTIRNYVSSIFKKLDVSNRSQAVLYGQRLQRYLG